MGASTLLSPPDMRMFKMHVRAMAYKVVRDKHRKRNGCSGSRYVGSQRLASQWLFTCLLVALLLQVVTSLVKASARIQPYTDIVAIALAGESKTTIRTKIELSNHFSMATVAICDAHQPNNTNMCARKTHIVLTRGL